ncbi:MAG: hypothetical protein QME21_17435 [Anaerolineales bacterium]|nr:hypothetical protein [Anaerolineales bacterium]
MGRQIFAHRHNEEEMARLRWLADHWGLSLGAAIQKAVDEAFEAASGQTVEPAPGRRGRREGASDDRPE